MNEFNRGDIIAFRGKHAVVVFVFSCGDLICAPLEMQPEYDHRAFVFIPSDVNKDAGDYMKPGTAVLCVLGRVGPQKEMMRVGGLPTPFLEQIETVSAMEIKARRVEERSYARNKSARNAPPEVYPGLLMTETNHSASRNSLGF